jgi:hypothetical protein
MAGELQDMEAWPPPPQPCGVLAGSGGYEWFNPESWLAWVLGAFQGEAHYHYHFMNILIQLLLVIIAIITCATCLYVDKVRLQTSRRVRPINFCKTPESWRLLVARAQS